MPRTRPLYAPEFRRQMIELVRTGRDPTDLAGAFEPSSQAIRNRVAQADREEGRREVKPPTAETTLPPTERDELARLRREVERLRLERARSASRPKLSRATAWFARAQAAKQIEGTIPFGPSNSRARTRPPFRSA